MGCPQWLWNTYIDWSFCGLNADLPPKFCIFDAAGGLQELPGKRFHGRHRFEPATRQHLLWVSSRWIIFISTCWTVAWTCSNSPALWKKGGRRHQGVSPFLVYIVKCYQYQLSNLCSAALPISFCHSRPAKGSTSNLVSAWLRGKTHRRDNPPLHFVCCFLGWYFWHIISLQVVLFSPAFPAHLPSTRLFLILFEPLLGDASQHSLYCIGWCSCQVGIVFRNTLRESIAGWPTVMPQVVRTACLAKLFKLHAAGQV